MQYEEFLRRVPKVELHCHFEGTVRPGTAADLARKHGIQLPTDDVDRLYDYDSIYEFLEIFALVSSTLIDQDDFARAAYESLEDGVQLGNLEYREMFFNPTLHTKRGVPYKTVVDGLVDGIQEAERKLGVRCRLIADVYRQDPPELARQMVEEVLEHRRDERESGLVPAAGVGQECGSAVGGQSERVMVNSLDPPPAGRIHERILRTRPRGRAASFSVTWARPTAGPCPSSNHRPRPFHAR